MSQHMIAPIVKALSKQYQDAQNLSSSREINQGYCVEFADDLVWNIEDVGGLAMRPEKVTEDDLKFAEGLQPPFQSSEEGWNQQAFETVYRSPLPAGWTVDKLNAAGETGYHAWVQCGGRFYDAEMPEGTENLFLLPFYQRFFARQRHMM